MARNSLHMFNAFVSAVALDEESAQSEFSAAIKALCEKAPAFAHFLGEEILNNLKNDADIDDHDPVIQESGDVLTQSRKRRKQQDPSYRPPRSVKPKRHVDGDASASSITVMAVDPPSDCDGLPDVETRRGLTSPEAVAQTSLDLEKDVNSKADASAENACGFDEDIFSSFKDSLDFQLDHSAQEGAGDISFTLGKENDSSILCASLDTSAPEPYPGADVAAGVATLGPAPLATVNDRGQDDISGISHVEEPRRGEIGTPPVGEQEEHASPSTVSFARENREPTAPIPALSKVSERGTETEPQNPKQHVNSIFPQSSEAGGASSLTQSNLGEPKEHQPPTLTVVVPVKPEQQEHVHHTAPSTPNAQIDSGEQRSPPTEEVPRTTFSPLPSLPAISALESSLLHPQTLTVEALVAEGLATIHKISLHQAPPPSESHSAVLRIIRPDLRGTPNDVDDAQHAGAMWVTDPRKWSADMWVRLLEAGHSRSKKTSILNMIEWMGASVWYDAQLEQLAKAPPLTKRGKPRARVASALLDSLRNGESESGSGLAPKRRRLSSGCATDDLPAEHPNIKGKVADRSRRTIIHLVHRGRKLRTMVSKVGLGILLLENIWTYEKMKDDEFDSKVSDECQRDPRKMKILSIFEDQVRLLVDEGQPSLSHFLSSLESDKIIPSSEISELRIEYGLETEPISEDSTTAQAGHLADKVRKLLSKPGVEPDTIMIRDNIELPVDSINRIRRGQWLDMWTIAAAMELTDKPSCVRYGLSVPLHDDKSGRPITNPFGLWRRKIDEYRRNADSDEKLVYFCPLNLNANHFTLLEVNEQNRMILHYDSMATHSNIGRSDVKGMVEAGFTDLGFRYEHAPCPQQEDGSSCGLMVIRNAALRMNGREVGNWDDKVDPGRVLRQLIGLLQSGLENNALQPKVAVRRSKRKLGEQS